MNNLALLAFETIKRAVTLALIRYCDRLILRADQRPVASVDGNEVFRSAVVASISDGRVV